jgi:hypothetical protein
MLCNAVERRRINFLVPPALRRQIAGNFDYPYDLDDYGNRDLKLFIREYLKNYKIYPSSNEIDEIALFSAEENLQHLKTQLAKL